MGTNWYRSKQIDDRYHSASGLKHDLLEVKRRMATGDLDSLHNFKIGTKDITYVFTLPATMVGRQWEQEESKFQLPSVAAII